MREDEPTQSIQVRNSDCDIRRKDLTLNENGKGEKDMRKQTGTESTKKAAKAREDAECYACMVRAAGGKRDHECEPRRDGV